MEGFRNFIVILCTRRLLNDDSWNIERQIKKNIKFNKLNTNSSKNNIKQWINKLTKEQAHIKITEIASWLKPKILKLKPNLTWIAKTNIISLQPVSYITFKILKQNKWNSWRIHLNTKQTQQTTVRSYSNS